ncbi:outer membrane beta-barrel protein [Vibrio toranzoniae]|uniref:outer membrane beta-barrel protein n=1 Tax=Vibrio toranzoniae TaxID=1194427 RepID=UPI0013779BD8|nr:outer membrane beta-barrel protein [Vibrio toranzoniae]NAZ45431.1 outer membrane beta-barrel protein [Vibrio toranzoniae]NAZ93038.1 outer membrane beta-barrel protein [Vibrio toranzoniae]
MLRKTIITTTLLMLTSAAYANPYIGASVGQANFDSANFSVDSTYGSNKTPLKLEDDSSLAGKIYGGYQFNRYIALEGSIGGYDALDGGSVTVGDMKFAAIQPKVILPVNDRFNLFAKAGVAYFNAEFKVSNSFVGATGHSTFSDTTMTGMYGLGADFSLTENLRIEATWDYMKPDLEVAKLLGTSASVDAEISVFSLGMNYHF